MARASTETLLSIDEWGQILGISPWELNQCAYPGGKSAQCNDVIYQHQYQLDHLSREEIAQAIADAENMIRNALLYAPAPFYTVDEIVMYPRPYQRELYGYAGTWRGEWKTVPLHWHKFISAGVYNRTLIQAGAAVVLSDEDGDGVDDLATITVATALTDASEIALYFTSTDRLNAAIDDTWRIRPLTTTISGGNAIIKCHPTQLILPILQEGVNPQKLDATVAAIYATTLDCYRVFTDDTATDANPYQGVAIWKNDPDCTQDCTFSLIPLCLGQQQPGQGQVFASLGDSCNWPFPYREPDRLQVNYVSGLPLENGRMNKDMARAIAYLSISLVANEACGCERTNRILARWKAPILRFQDTSASATAFADSSNPFPMTVGGQFAWQYVKQHRNLEVVSI